jgi:hypothetical protein
VTDLNAKQSTRKSDVFSVVLGVALMATGGVQLLVEHTDPVRLVVGALNLILGAAAAVTAWRGSTRREWVWVFVCLNGLYWTVFGRFGRSDPSGPVAGTVLIVVAVAALVIGGLTLWQYRKRRT